MGKGNKTACPWETPQTKEHAIPKRTPRWCMGSSIRSAVRPRNLLRGSGGSRYCVSPGWSGADPSPTRLERRCYRRCLRASDRDGASREGNYTWFGIAPLCCAQACGARKELFRFCFPPLKRRATTNRPAHAGLVHAVRQQDRLPLPNPQTHEHAIPRRTPRGRMGSSIRSAVRPRNLLRGSGGSRYCCAPGCSGADPSPTRLERRCYRRCLRASDRDGISRGRKTMLGSRWHVAAWGLVGALAVRKRTAPQDCFVKMY
jgi:hypothetical protein